MFRPSLYLATLLFLGSPSLLCSQSPDGPAPIVALTFDDLPAHGPLAPGQKRSDVVTAILATLQREKLPPVYGFVNGFRLEDYPYQLHILQAWQRAGQALGNHTYEHNEFDKETSADFARDVLKDEAPLRKADPTGDWHWFRFPYLEEGDTAKKRAAARSFLAAHGYKIAEVSIDFQDARWNDAFGACSAAHNPEGIAKLHDSYIAAADEAIKRSRTLAHTLYGRDVAYIALLHVGSFDERMLPDLIALYRARGFTFATLPEAAADPAYRVDPGLGVKGGISFLEMIAISRGVPIPPPSLIPDSIDNTCTAGKFHWKP